MALGSFGSFLGQVGRVLPGYVEGYRNAVKDNWSDMANYNTVEKGQIDNLYNMVTFGNDVDRSNYNTEIARLSLLRGAGDTGLYLAGYPGMLADRMAYSAFAPLTAGNRQAASWLESQWLINQLLSGNFNPGMRGNGAVPSGVA